MLVNDHTSCSELYVFVIVVDNATLRELRVNGNDIGDDGMAMILEALQSNKALTELYVHECGISMKGS